MALEVRNRKRLWQDILLNKYAEGKCLSGIKPKTRDSQFWMGLMSLKEIFYKYVKKIVGNVQNIRFWEDWWLDDKPLKKSYPGLYGLCFTKSIKPIYVINNWRDRFHFRRTLLGDTFLQWNEIKNMCADIFLSETKDMITWSLTVGKNSLSNLYIINWLRMI